jgi:hypothetical protein
MSPPPPPPPPLSLPPPPPPATTTALSSVVPDPVVKHPVQVVVVTMHFPKEVLFSFPIMPPLLAMS